MTDNPPTLFTVALIGSRKTPQTILTEVRKIGTAIATKGWVARSGHASGFDYAAEEGAGLALIAYLPYGGFNSNLPVLGLPVVVPPRDDLDALVKKFHPAFLQYAPHTEKLPPPDAPVWYPLTKFAFDCHRRNGCQVLGLGLDEPADAVVCWTPNGGEDGGTGQALRIAKGHNIPIANLALEQFRSPQLIMDWLEKIWEVKCSKDFGA